MRSNAYAERFMLTARTEVTDRMRRRFITVLPRSRKEDAAFRACMQDHQPDWAEAHRAPGARLGDPDQVWSVCEAPWSVGGGVPDRVGAGTMPDSRSTNGQPAQAAAPPAARRHA